MIVLVEELYNLKDEANAKFLSRFFRTAKGEYGEGDKFLGIKVPIQRNVVKKYYKDLSLKEVEEMLHNKYHEVRLSALLTLIYKMKGSNQNTQKKIYELYLNNTKYINNWDLVDTSSPHIVGYYIYEYNIDRKILYELAKSNDLWKQRIAIIATQYFIRKNDFEDTINIALILLNNNHDLIHKAVGWMLREIGNKDCDKLYYFLTEHYKEMPRTMLRYAIENYDEETRKMFLKN